MEEERLAEQQRYWKEQLRLQTERERREAELLEQRRAEANVEQQRSQLQENHDAIDEQQRLA